MPTFSDYPSPEEEANLQRYRLQEAQTQFEQLTAPITQRLLRPLVEAAARERFEAAVKPIQQRLLFEQAKALFDQVTQPISQRFQQATRPLPVSAPPPSLGQLYGDTSIGHGPSPDDTRQNLPPAPTNLEAGTPEGEALLGQLSRTAADHIPGLRGPEGYLRDRASVPMTADTPVENAATIGANMLTPISLAGDVVQAGAKGILDRLPGGDTVPDWAKERGITESTPVVGGLLQHDTAIPMALGALTPGPGEAVGAANWAMRRGDDLTRVAQATGRAVEREFSTAPAIVPVNTARRLAGDVQLPPPGSPAYDALSTLSGARLTPEGLELDLSRFQNSQMAGQPATLRGGVFYGPVGDTAYRATDTPGTVGGAQHIAGTSLFKRPLVLMGGFTNVEHAPAALFGEERYQAILNDVYDAVEAGDIRALARVFANQGVPDAESVSASIFRHITDESERLPAAMDRIAGDLSRQRGHDGIMVLKRRPGAPAVLEEVMDLREATFPTPDGGHRLRPEFSFSNVAESVLPRGAAATQGEQLADLGAGTAGAVTGYATAPEDATTEERLARAGTGFALATGAGPSARTLGRVARGTVDELGIVAQPQRETVGQAIDRVGKMLQDGRGTPAPGGEIEKAITSLGTRFYSAVWASERPLARAQELVYKALGRQPTAAENAELAYRLYAGRHAAAAQHIEEGLLPALKGLSKPQEDLLERYLILADNWDKGQAIGRRGGQAAQDARRFSGDVHAHDLAAVQQEFIARYGAANAQRVFEAAEHVWQFTAGLRDRLHKAGIISKQLHQELASKFPHYSPANILKYLPEDGPASLPPGRPTLTLSETGLKRLTEEGTTQAREHPLASIIRYAFAVENQTRRNQGAQAILKMVEQSPELSQAFKPVLTAREARAKGLKAGQYAPHTYKLDVNETKFSVFVDGAQREYVAPKSYEPLFRMEPSALTGMAKTVSDILEVGSGTPLLRAGATSLNATFIPVNAVRDAFQFLLRQDVRRLPTNLGALGRAYWDSFTNDGGADWDEAIKVGAGMASPYFGKSPAEIRRLMLREGALGGRIRPVAGFTDVGEMAGVVGDVFNLLLSPVAAVGTRVERAPRLAAYRLAKAAGLSDQEAALAARDITIDFSRGGEAVKFLNRYIPFLNVAFQGMERLVTYDLRRGHRQAAAAGIVTGLTASLLAEAWNRHFDPEGYADVPDYLKTTGIVLMTPIQVAGEDGTRNLPIWLPIPNEYQLFKEITNEGVRRAMGDDPHTWERISKSLLNVISPVGADLIPLPPVAQVYHDLQANYDTFRGRNIVPANLRRLPPEEQYNESTSAVGRAIGRTLGVSPKHVDYAVQGVAGGLGRQALDAGNMVARALGAEAPEPKPTNTVVDAPVVGGIAGRFARTNAHGQQERDAREREDRNRQAIIREVLAELSQSPSYRKATPEERRIMRERVAGKLEARLIRSRYTGEVAAAERAKLSMPRYRGVLGTPDDILLQNLTIEAAKAKLQEYKRRYGAEAGSQRLKREDREAWNLAQREEVNQGHLRIRDRRIDAVYGVTEDISVDVSFT